MKDLVDLTESIAKKAGVKFIFGFPNDNSYLVLKKVLKYKDIGRLNTYVYPYRIGGIKHNLSFLNPISKACTRLLGLISMFIWSHKEATFLLDKNRKLYDQYRYQWFSGKYKIVSLLGFNFVYRIESHEGIRTAFRAPGFSITKNNVWALHCLVEMGFKYDCSMFPAPHDYGGMPSYGEGVPKRIDVGDGRIIKEFPMNIHPIMGKHIVFSGGGFFRLFPYWLINHWGKHSDYMMTYFHPRDFDAGQPIMKALPAMRRFKSYVGIKGAFTKFQRLLDHYEFYNVEQADEIMNWEIAPIVALKSLK